MNACIIFDVSHKIEGIKATLKQLGYWGAWSSNGNLFNLPHNSLWKPNCELLQAKSDINNVISNFNLQPDNITKPIILYRCIILPVNPWEGIVGTPA